MPYWLAASDCSAHGLSSNEPKLNCVPDIYSVMYENLDRSTGTADSIWPRSADMDPSSAFEFYSSWGF